jgi:two-component system chemotaxis response regulator CheB
MSRAAPIRVLVIDDSAFSRRMIARMLKTSPLVEVVDVARDGEDALRKAVELRPDLITLDLAMPRMDGFTFLRILMKRCPTPVIVISGRSGDEEVFQALELGAVDFIAKKTARAAPDLASIERELIRKVHASRELRIDRVRRRLSALPPVVDRSPGPGDSAPRVVAIGASTGGPAALMQIFAAFPDPPGCAFLVAQHMPEGFTRGFADRLDRFTSLRAAEARGGEALAPGTVWVAPGGRHLELENRAGRVVTRVVPTLPRDRYAPSVDRLFESAAKHLGADVLAVVLTGMGDDGRAGVGAVKAAGGRAIAESEETAVVFGMPKRAIRTGAVDRVLPLGEIAGAIQQGGADGGWIPSRRAPHGW